MKKEEGSLATDFVTDVTDVYARCPMPYALCPIPDELHFIQANFAAPTMPA